MERLFNDFSLKITWTFKMCCSIDLILNNEKTNFPRIMQIY